jgi:four helix bundle protein
LRKKAYKFYTNGILSFSFEFFPGRTIVNPAQSGAKTFQDLIALQRAHRFVIEVYRLTSVFPKSETYALASQMRRAAVSIPANIAEGFKRRGKADKARFMNIAEASLEESRYYLILATDLRYDKSEYAMSLLEEVSRLLHAYASTILNSEFFIETGKSSGMRSVI